MSCPKLKHARCSLRYLRQTKIETTSYEALRQKSQNACEFHLPMFKHSQRGNNMLLNINKIQSLDWEQRLNSKQAVEKTVKALIQKIH